MLLVGKQLDRHAKAATDPQRKIDLLIRDDMVAVKKDYGDDRRTQIVDAGIDDGLALLYACASPEIDLVAVTCAGGNVAARQVADLEREGAARPVTAVQEEMAL